MCNLYGPVQYVFQRNSAIGVRVGTLFAIHIIMTSRRDIEWSSCYGLHCQGLTCKFGEPQPLVVHGPARGAFPRKWRLEHKATHVVSAFERTLAARTGRRYALGRRSHPRHLYVR